MSAKDAVPLLTRLGDVSAALNVPIGELSDLYGKAKVQGRMIMEDINQLAGRGIPIYSALAKVMGVNKDEIRGLVEEGKVGFPQLEAAFVDMTKKGSLFGGMMDKQSRSFAGLWSTVKDNATQLFGMVVEPAFKWLTKEGLPKAIELVEKFSKGWKRGGLEGGIAAIFNPQTARKVVGALESVKSVTLGIFDAAKSVAGVFINLPAKVQQVIISVGLLAAAMKLLNVPIVLPKVAAGGAARGAAGMAAGMAGSAGVYGVVAVSVVAMSAGAAYLIGRAMAKAAAREAASGKDTLKGNPFGGIADIKTRSDLQKWTLELNDLKRQLADEMALGIDTTKTERDIARLQLRIDTLANTVSRPIMAGHINAKYWMSAFSQGENALSAFKSHVSVGIDTGPLDTSSWTSAMYRAYQVYLNIKAGMQAPVSSHGGGGGKTKHYNQNGVYIGTWAQGGIVNGPQLGMVGEAGPEAIIPLTNPRRAAEVMAEAGLLGAGGNINVNVIVPGGTTLIGTAREVGEIIAPHVARALGREAARAGRRR